MADNEWVDVTDQHLAQGSQDGEWEDVTTQQSPETKAQHMKRLVDSQMANLTPENVGGAARNALSAMTGGALSKLMPEAGLLARSAADGAQGAAQDEDKLRGFLTGAGSTLGMGLLAKPLAKGGDVAMQLAVGRKKYTPGVGTELADQGIWGFSRDGMRKRVEGRLVDNGEQMLTAAQGANPINARQIGNEIRQDASRPIATDAMGRPMQLSQRDVPAVEAINEFADDVASRGEESAIQALGRRRAAGSSAYSMKSGDPKQSQVAQLSKMEQQKYSEALKAADPTGKLAEADKGYAALKRAQRGLSEEPSMSGLGLISRPISSIGGAGLTSIAGQAATKSAQSLEEFLAPLIRQSVVNQKK